MQRIFFFQIFLCLVFLIGSIHSEAATCNVISNVLTCRTTNSLYSVDTSLYNSNTYNSITINYEGTVRLNLVSRTPATILIKPIDVNGIHALQITNIVSNSSRIDIKLSLSSNQLPLPLFPADHNIIATTSTVSITVIENNIDAINYTIFDTSNSSTILLQNYEIIFDQQSNYVRTLNLLNLVSGIKNATSITIRGNKHILNVDNTTTVRIDKANKLVMQNLRLHSGFLNYFPSLQEFIIEECDYNKTAKFLISSNTYNLSLVMRNNNPLSRVLPNTVNAFTNLSDIKSLTLVEPLLNSTILTAIRLEKPATLLLELSMYEISTLTKWAEYKPLIRRLTINNISNLDQFPSKFFNKFYPIEYVKLQGNFQLKKQHLCIFYGMNIQSYLTSKVVEIDNGKNWNNNNPCAEIYIAAVNQKTIEGIVCPGGNTCEGCAQWARQAAECDFVSFESTCTGETDPIGNGRLFTYNDSYLYYFFQNKTCPYSSTPSGKSDSINIGAIIGAVCGLLIAFAILATTVFCVHKSRKNVAAKTSSSAAEEKYKPLSYDSRHVSIATSKSSQSSRYALEKSFFPSIQPNDEVAPPLYTAPSEAVSSVSNYQMPKVPSAPRASVSTHATHLYETLDS